MDAARSRGCSSRLGTLDPLLSLPEVLRASMTVVRCRGPLNCALPHAGAADRLSSSECGIIDKSLVLDGRLLITAARGLRRLLVERAQGVRERLHNRRLGKGATAAFNNATFH